MKTYRPSFCFSFLSSSSKFGLIINTSPINKIEVIKNVPKPPNPNFISVPIVTNMYISPTGFLLLQHAAKIASPKGAHSPLKLTVDTIKLIMYRNIYFD